MKNKVIIFVIALVSLFLSCDRMEPYTNVEFMIVNDSGFNVELKYFNYIIESGHNIKDTTFIIPENAEIRVIYNDDMGSSIYGYPLGVAPDSVYITFNNAKRIIYRRNDSIDKGILGINNYEER